jgi:hypothetical protein
MFLILKILQNLLFVLLVLIFSLKIFLQEQYPSVIYLYQKHGYTPKTWLYVLRNSEATSLLPSRRK